MPLYHLFSHDLNYELMSFGDFSMLMNLAWIIYIVITLSKQIGEQNLAFGIKFNAKGVVDCYEKELETLPSGMKRDIEFKMIEGDFQLFEGKWSILQVGFLFVPLLLEFFWIKHNKSYTLAEIRVWGTIPSTFQMLNLQVS